MDVTTQLVSDEKEVWYDLGRLFWDDAFVAKLKSTSDPQPLIRDLLLKGDDINEPSVEDEAEAERLSSGAAEWMRAHSDWRFHSEIDEDEEPMIFYVYDEAEIDETRAQVDLDGDERFYIRDGSIWSEV